MSKLVGSPTHSMYQEGLHLLSERHARDLEVSNDLEADVNTVAPRPCLINTLYSRLYKYVVCLGHSVRSSGHQGCGANLDEGSSFFLDNERCQGTSLQVLYQPLGSHGPSQTSFTAPQYLSGSVLACATCLLDPKFNILTAPPSPSFASSACLSTCLGSTISSPSA